MQLIELTNVFKIYNEGHENEVRALNGVSLRIDYGEFVAIIDSSGSGKSTMMNILGCLDLPTRGEYCLAGQRAAVLSDNALALARNQKIGFIFQGYNLIRPWTCWKTWSCPSSTRGPGRPAAGAGHGSAGAGRAVRQGQQPPFGDVGGQQQRVAIARAISTHAPVLMADEPTGALDSKTGIHVLEILHQLHDEGATIILITHDNKVAATAERIVRVADGIITLDAAREEVDL